MENSKKTEPLKQQDSCNEEVTVKKSIDLSLLLKEIANFSPRVPLTFYLATRKAIREKNSR